MIVSRLGVGLLLLSALSWSCGPEFDEVGPVLDEHLGAGEDAFSSVEASLLDFSFDGELVTSGPVYGSSAQQRIQDQLLYSIGQLNGRRSVGRLDRLQLSNVRMVRQSDGLVRITYRAVLPVAWGLRAEIPAQFELVLPKEVTQEGLGRFTQSYSHSCVDSGAHDVDAGSMWYYYRPLRSGCALLPNDVVHLAAQVSPSTLNTRGKYPEYDRVWEDGALEVVAIFGKYEDGTTTDEDSGIAGYNRFVRSLRSELRGATVTTTPSFVPEAPGTAVPDITFEAKWADGRRLKLTVLLVDNVRTGNPDYDFDARYEALSPTADVIMYNGHAGLGQNVRALSNKGRFVPRKYLIVFMNGCDTFAYVDGSLAEARARLNPDDPSGTKYMEMVTNAMPAYFHQMPVASLALIGGLLRKGQPLTYEAMFRNVDKSQVVVVTGEEDNVFSPGSSPGSSPGGAQSPTWSGLTQTFTLGRDDEQRVSTPSLPPGRYVFELSGSGDGDLYVRRNVPPTAQRYDCRPYLDGSAERCTVELREPTVLHLWVHGYAENSVLRLVARPE